MKTSGSDTVIVYTGSRSNASKISAHLVSEGVPSSLFEVHQGQSEFFENTEFNGLKVIVASENEIFAKQLILRFREMHLI